MVWISRSGAPWRDPSELYDPWNPVYRRRRASSKIHAVVEAYGYPSYIILSQEQRNDINYTIPVPKPIPIDRSQVVTDRGYDSGKLLDYIYSRNGDTTIPSKIGSNFGRHCDW